MDRKPLLLKTCLEAWCLEWRVKVGDRSSVTFLLDSQPTFDCLGVVGSAHTEVILYSL